MNPNKTVDADNVPTPQPRSDIPHDEVAARAEKLWRERQCPAGADEAIWLEAESQLQAEAEARAVTGTPSRPYVDEPGTQLRTRTKVQDPADAAVQTRSDTATRSRQTADQLRNQ